MTFGFPMYDPADLTKEQLLELLGIDEQHRIVLIEGDGSRAIIVDLDEMDGIKADALSMTADKLFRNPPPVSPYFDKIDKAASGVAPPLTVEEIKRQVKAIFDEPIRNVDPFS